MNKVTSIALFFLAAGLVTSVTILGAFQIFFSISVIYFSCLALKQKNFKLPPSTYWLLGFIVIALTTTLLNFDIIPKPSKNLGRIKYFIYGVGGIFVFRSWLEDLPNKTKAIILNTFLLSVVIGGLYALRIYFFTDDSRARPLTETMRYGYGSAMFLLTLISGYLHRERFMDWLNPKFLLLAILIGFLGMFFTYTRGALLGFLCGLPFALYFYNKKYAIIGSAASILIVGGLAGFYFFGKETSKFRLLSTQSISSDQIRKSQWQAGIIAIKERPVLGWGLSNFHSQLKRIKEEYDLPAKDYDDAHTHNLFLEIGAGTGLIGLFFFLGWLISWACECFRDGHLVRALVVPFGVAFVVGSQFEVTFDANNASMIFTVYSLSVALYASGRTNQTSS